MPSHHHRGSLRNALKVGAILLLSVPGRAAPQAVGDALRAHLQAERVPNALLVRVYQQRDYRPAWLGEQGPSPRAWELAQWIDGVRSDGLDPQDYQSEWFEGSLGPSFPADSLAQLELRLTSAMLALGEDLARGRINPAAANSLWTRAPTTFDLVAAAGTVMDAARVPEALAQLAPPAPQYALLRSALARYREVAARGGRKTIARGDDLVPTLRARLAEEGDLPPGDSALEEGVRHFQARHGLATDGVVGPATLAALNVPAAERVRQIELNLERWRWLPRELGERYVMVNSAAFTLEVRDHGRRVMEMPVIVGRPDWPTPIASGRITALVFSPVWDIPPAIASQEILPLIRKDSTYIARHGISVFRDSGKALLPVDPVTVDWSAMTESTFTLRLKQAPGYDNPLGAVKTIFGSRFNVCMHDTPVRASFQERVRTFSHGCVRVARAAELATYLLDDSVRWTSDSVRKRMAVVKEEPVPLVKSVPGYLAYWTAWVDDDGSVEFRDDVYGWDRQLAAALARRRRQSEPP
ncbi:MAG TPA: L,D-transpeptidase family protein [Gemmatimonadales bacterium]|nr:L,D-transpeptidase family protein [Gemmatimonadales bacterium]